MAMELVRFLGGALILLVPGICLARVLSLGQNVLERCAIGSSLGLAMAVYLASAVSQIDLRWFYPIWWIFTLVCIAWRLKFLRRPTSNAEKAAQIWMVLVLLAVGATRYAIALPLVLPPGTLDPSFHLILARQIQILHHAIDHWPFAGIPLNYPTGSHVLVVVLSVLAGLPLHTTFKDLIPLLGVLTTAQIYVFARRVSDGPLTALYAAAIYGLWAWFGSNDYFRWGGLPNELAMLLFLAMLSIDAASSVHLLPRISPSPCTQGEGRGGGRTSTDPQNPHPDPPPEYKGRGGGGLAECVTNPSLATIAMAICFASMVLVHHHVMVVASVILLFIVLWQMCAKRPWRLLAAAGVGGAVLDAFFLVPYAAHFSTFHSTGMAAGGEDILPLLRLPAEFGYALVAGAIVGIALCLARKVRCHPMVAIASFSLAGMFVIGEDVIPMVLGAMHRPAFAFFTPSRFLSDLNYFLPIFAAGAVAYFQRQFRVRSWICIFFVMVAPIADAQHWIAMAKLSDPPPQFLQACDWIQHNTPPDTIVDNVGVWATYLCWRKTALIGLPVSEPLSDYHPELERIGGILSGQIPPDSPDLIIVAMRAAHSYNAQPVLWRDQVGDAVILEWPITTSSSSAAVTPARRPPGPHPGSGPTSR
jgi:xanthosine utilization system XapX-like protein